MNDVDFVSKFLGKGSSKLTLPKRALKWRTQIRLILGLNPLVISPQYTISFSMSEF